MAKNVVVCCDGTANEFAKNNTNVVKLYSTLVQDSLTQVVFYHPGLGTMEPAGALTTIARKLTKLMGMAVGYGLANDIRDAYVFIMQNFQPGDRLFLFGFSRGAYTVRAVASLLRMYGLIRAGNEPLVPYAIRMMMGIKRAGRSDASAVHEYFSLAHEFRQTMAQDCRPWFVGVWDTVNSVGWVENPLKLPYTANNSHIKFGRHAVAIDERRAFFRTNLWKRQEDPADEVGPEDLKQVWFPGVHCDVGGGYDEEESGLSKVALEWMLAEAKACQLLLDDAKVGAILGRSPSSKATPPDFDGKAHESLKESWMLAEFILKKHWDYQKKKETRRMNLFRRRTIPPASLVHTAAFLRKDNYKQRLPDDAVQTRTLPI